MTPHRSAPTTSAACCARPSWPAPAPRSGPGEIDADALRGAEDEAIRDVIALQHEAGLQTVTDGEFRRSSWHMDFIYALEGVEQVEGESIHVQFRSADGELDFSPPAMRIAAPIRSRRRSSPTPSRFLRDNARPGQTPKLTIPSPSMVHYRGGRAAIDPSVYPEIDAFWDDLLAAYRAQLRRRPRTRLPLPAAG